MQKRHTDRKLYFDEQSYTTQKYVIPYIEKSYKITSQTSILEIGCGEGGNLKPFMDLGCKCVGIDLNERQLQNAQVFFQDHPNHDNLELIFSDIYDIKRENFKFDVIMLRDVIEHIHNQERFMSFLKQFMNEGGIVFFAFPPWYMPFGGHQQICSGFLSKTPFIHLLPKRCYNRCIIWSEGHKSEALMEIKETGITIERFERIVKRNDYEILQKSLYFINPNYEIKFKLKQRKVLPIFRVIPYLRDFYTTAAYYVIKNK
ncbi:MAG: class I SAM-dependent methyltransferase [Bacteroidales bacterium]|nr:class I SAM-dependent methyltransferase [Bacteroidales bacterium]